MHVAAQTNLSTTELESRFRAEAFSRTCRLSYAADRSPPKFFLEDNVPVPRPAAEVHVEEADGGSNVVLRLMWGPLPAPFPRALAAIFVLAAATVLVIAGFSMSATIAAAVIAGLPLFALWWQRRGEQRLTSRLSEFINANTFVAVPH